MRLFDPQEAIWDIPHLTSLRKVAEDVAKKSLRAKSQTPAPTGRLIGYARVSTDQQELRLQLDALQRAGCANVWQEKASAFKAGRNRPQLENALIDIRPDDTLVVWRLDRLGRNMGELIKLLDRIRETGAGFKSLTENIDMTTPVGRLLFHIIGAFAQFEVDSTSQRTSAGMEAMRERGYRLGAPRIVSEAKAFKIVAEKHAGKSMAELARKYRVSPGTIKNTLRRYGRKRKPKTR